MTSIPTMLGLLLTGCTEREKEQKKELPDPVSFSIHECLDDYYCSIQTTPVSITEEDLLSLLDEDGQLSETTCVQICSDAEVVDVCECEFVGANELNSQSFLCSTYSCNENIYEGRGNGEIKKVLKGRGPNKVAEWSSRAFHAEASSVAAFLQIREELRRFGAPKTLQQRCLVAACEEVEHAKSMRRITKKLDGKISSLCFGELPNRSLLAFALDNVKEGCVNEAYAALCVLYQSQTLPPSRLQHLLATIAQDELRHVSLSYDIHHWCMKQLPASQRQQVLDTQKQALSQLLTSYSPKTNSPFPKPAKSIIEKLEKYLCAMAA